MEAYVRGVERFVESGGDATTVRSVASFFVSRVDTEADKRLEAIGSDEALALRGKLAVANARIAYENYKQVFSGGRWEALEAKGALPQRCLWASTSTKNPAYRDVLYVEDLIGPHTVNTMPEETIQAFQDHGEVRGDTVEDDLDEAHTLLEKQLPAVGIDYDDVVATLEKEGVQKFSDSFAELLEGVRAKRETVAA
jgi:transaldolase